MTVSYLDTVASLEAASTQGLAYAKLTRAMKVHVRSLVTEGHAAAFIGDEEVALNEPKAQVCITEKGVAYVELLQSSGLIVSGPAPKRKRSARKQPKAAPAKTARKPKRRNNPVSVSKRVPTPVESVTSPVLPEGEKARRLPGNQHGDTLHTDQPKVDTAQQIEDLERKVSALMAVLAS